MKKTFGTLSVRAGIDNNPNPTYADKIAGAKIEVKTKWDAKKGGCVMTKLCPRGKAAAKRKFKVYPSAYANAYASSMFRKS